MRIYHNPRCAKSRQTLQLIREKGVEPEVIEYLKTPPDREALQTLLSKLDMTAEELVRKGERMYKENYKGQSLSDAEWLDALVQHPKLIERPIVEKGERAVIGRPPENVLALL
jgi:arsenate reductase